MKKGHTRRNLPDCLQSGINAGFVAGDTLGKKSPIFLKKQGKIKLESG
jgi:hypothetical protein